MALVPGTRLGPYEILDPLGAGGMGQVWRARDSRLDRIVAIKVSAEQFTERFEREARNIAALNHPHICTLFDVGPDYLVMELLEGSTLAERIAAGPLLVGEALIIARQIADALEAAHEKGIVHRDLKPANIKITGEHKVKVLDFGLAKAQEPDGPPGDPALSPTLTISATRAGMIVGTAGYMSPEQARGKPVDRRADIWSFGVVLYEMLSGRQLYSGELASDLLAAVILKEPDWEALPPGTPPRIRELLGRCLRKDPKMRLRDIGDARIVIDEYLARPDAPQPASEAAPHPAARRWASVWVATTAVLLAAGLAGLAAIHFREKPPEAPVVRFELPAPQRPSFGNGMAISPDGKRIVYSHAASEGSPKLWLRALESLAAQALPGTEDGSFPFWSPDSRFIGFFTSGKLKKVDTLGGPPQTLCDVPNTGIGGSWSKEGVIVFGTNASGLFRVPQAGGAASPLTTLNTGHEVFHGRPWFLPDGKRFLFYVQSRQTENDAIFLATLESKDRKRLVSAHRGAAYVPPQTSAENGHLLFLREDILMAQPLDSRNLDPRGDPFPIAERVGASISNPFFSASANGALVYRAGGYSGYSQVAWFDREGKQLRTVGPSGVYFDLALSFDEKRIAVSRAEKEDVGAGRDVWLMNIADGVPTRFTFDPAQDSNAVWSPDGSRVVFASGREGGLNLYQKGSGGTGSEGVLLKSELEKRPYDWSADGRYLLYSVVDAKNKLDLWLLSNPGGTPNEQQPKPFLATPYNETAGQFSPVNTGNTRWIAYTSDESGKFEIYVQPFTEGSTESAGKFQISSDGGVQPRWRRDGKELYYLTRDGMLMAAEIKTTPRFEHGVPKPLFQTGIRASLPTLTVNFRYAPSMDGKRFLVNTLELKSASAPMIVVLNWPAGFRK